MSAGFAWRRENRFDWTPARITKLCTRYGDGQSFARIASELGCSRSSAIGRFDRLRQAADAHLYGTRGDDLVTMLEDDLGGGDLAGIAAALGVPVAAVEVRFAEIRRGLGPQAV